MAGINKGITSYGTHIPSSHALKSWTPTLKAETSGTITVAAADWRYYGGKYSRKDNTVFVEFFFRVESVSSPVGPLRLGGLPFLIDNQSSVAISMTGLSVSPDLGSIMCSPQSRSLFCYIEGFSAGQMYEMGPVMEAGVTFRGQFTYQTTEGEIANEAYLLDEREAVEYPPSLGFDNDGVGLGNDGFGFGDDLNPSTGGNFGGFLV